MLQRDPRDKLLRDANLTATDGFKLFKDNTHTIGNEEEADDYLSVDSTRTVFEGKATVVMYPEIARHRSP